MIEFIGSLYNSLRSSQIAIVDWTLSASDHTTLIHYFN
jgi:hypothetical protein